MNGKILRSMENFSTAIIKTSRFTTNPGNVYAFYISKRTTKFNPSDKFNCSTEETFSNYSRCLRGYVTKKLVGERETGR